MLLSPRSCLITTAAAARLTRSTNRTKFIRHRMIRKFLVARPLKMPSNSPSPYQGAAVRTRQVRPQVVVLARAVPATPLHRCRCGETTLFLTPRQAPSTPEPGRIGAEASIGRLTDGESRNGAV